MRSLFLMVFLLFSYGQPALAEPESGVTAPEGYRPDEKISIEPGAHLSQANGNEILQAVLGGDFRAQATSYDGRKFDRRFDLQAKVALDPAAKARAKTRQFKVCDTDEEGVPTNDCQEMCETAVNFKVGTITVKLHDKQFGTDIEKVLPLSASASSQKEKQGNQPCPQQDLKGLEIHSGDPTGDLFFSLANAQKQIVELHVGKPGYGADGRTMHGTLKSLGGQNYGIDGASISSQIPVDWTYVHESNPAKYSSWATSGVLNLKQ
jgi:hypothetical protein